MASRISQQSARMILRTAAARSRPLPALRTVQRPLHQRPFSQALPAATQVHFPLQRRHSSSTSTTATPIQLQASADSANRKSLMTAVAEAVSACGGWLTETKTNSQSDVFVMEGVGSEQLAAFHSHLESLMMDWNQSTQRFLEDCYFKLVQGNGNEGNQTAVLQLNWRN